MKTTTKQPSSGKGDTSVAKIGDKPVMSKLDAIAHKLGVFEVIFGQVPAKANRYKVGKGKMYRDVSVSDYERSFILQCQQYKGLMIDFEFEFAMIVYFKSKASDLDNAAKTVLDCLQKAGAIKNDNLCMVIKLEKRIDKSSPRIEYYIKPI